jgi:hypothetical protein
MGGRMTTNTLMSVRAKLGVAVLSLAAASAPAHAESIYKWLDDEGYIHYSQSIPPDVIAREHQRLNGQAVVVEHVESADVPNMVAQAELTLDQKARRIEKRLLLATYNSPDDIAAERDAALTYLDKEAVITERYLAILNERLGEARYMYSRLADDRGLAYSTLQSTIQSLSESIHGQQDRLVGIERKRQLVHRQYEEEVSRFQEALQLSENNELEIKLPALNVDN